MAKTENSDRTLYTHTSSGRVNIHHGLFADSQRNRDGKQRPARKCSPEEAKWAENRRKKEAYDEEKRLQEELKEVWS